MESVSTAEQQMSIAEKYYLSHKESMRKYQQRNKEKIKEKNKEYLAKISADPEKRKAYLDKKREYYINITKPKLEAMKKQETATAVN